MSLREDMYRYEQITGESAEHVPIIKLGAFLDGYEMGLKTIHTCEDAVSRDVVINAICAWGTKKERNSEVMIPIAEVKQSVADIVADLPSIQPQRMQGIEILEDLSHES